MRALDQQYFTRPAAQGGDFDALRFELGQLPSEKDLAVPLLTWLKEEEAEKMLPTRASVEEYVRGQLARGEAKMQTPNSKAEVSCRSR